MKLNLHLHSMIIIKEYLYLKDFVCKDKKTVDDFLLKNLIVEYLYYFQEKCYLLLPKVIVIKTE